MIMMMMIEETMTFSAITGYVTAKYNQNWWLACVLQTLRSLLETKEVEVSFLHPYGSSKSLKYSHPADILLISYEDILTSVNPTTATGPTYALITQDEKATASRTLSPKLKTDKYAMAYNVKKMQLLTGYNPKHLISIVL